MGTHPHRHESRRSALAHALAFGLALLAAAFPICARAEPASAPELHWVAQPACPTHAFMDRVAALAGLGPDELGAKLLRVDAVVRLTERGDWKTRLTIETTAGAGERSFAAEDCSTLVEGAALIVALTIDPSLPSEKKGPPGPVETDAGAQPVTTRTRPRIVLRPLVAADVGLLPHVALATGLAAGLAWPRFRMELDGSYLSAQDVADGLGRGGRIRVLVDSRARACWVGRTGRIEPAACAGPAVAWLRSQGQTGLAVAETHRTLFVALGGGAAVGLQLRDWLWLRVEGSLDLAVRRPRFSVVDGNRGAREVHTARPLTGRMGGGVEFRF